MGGRLLIHERPQYLYEIHGNAFALPPHFINVILEQTSVQQL
jgi:hypothetical protein